MTRICRALGVVVKVVMPLGILLGTFALAKYQMDTSREAQQLKPPRQARMVDVIAVQRADVRTVVHAMGTVLPAQEIALMPQVSGQVVSLSPAVVPGGLVTAGEALLEIDPRDYEFSIEQCHQAVAQARLDLKLEQGNQVVAQAEYDLLDELVSQQDRELVLREPHLQRTEAAVEASEAALGQAELNRDRCRITAPFNGVIQDKQVDRGATVSPSTRLLTLIGTDAYWIEVRVRTDELKWIQIPRDTVGKGPPVRVFDKSQWGPDVSRQGCVIRLLPDLEARGRMARVLIRIEDPLSLESGDLPSLLIGSYVRVEITGRTIRSAFPVARDHLRNGNTVWIMNAKNELEIRPVEIAYRDKTTVYVSRGLEPGERLVVTDLGAPVETMPLGLGPPSPDQTFLPANGTENPS
jgi:RND family efflux transporter MFP subunit